MIARPTSVPSLRELLDWAASEGIPRLEAELLLADALGWNRTRLHTWPEARPDPAVSDHYRDRIRRRRSGEPVAYILGRREFWSLDLGVTPATLIPRPETELLVEIALTRIPAEAAWRIADLGTGSGAIALALAKERPQCRITATDRSSAALAVATDNARRHRLDNVEFRGGSWWDAVGEQRFQLIVSNPPYIASTDAHLTRGDLVHEPRSALAAGDDGLDAIRAIARGCLARLEAGGWLLLEHGCEQGDAVRSLLWAAGLEEVATQRDLAGLERATLGRAPL